jgi:hypothetical protein
MVCGKFLDIIHLFWLFSKLVEITGGRKGEITVSEWDREYLIDLLSALSAGSLKAYDEVSIREVDLLRS